jgi:hypothetical protein
VRGAFIWENRVADLADRYRSIVGRHAGASGDGAAGPVCLAEGTT